MDFGVPETSPALLSSAFEASWTCETDLHLAGEVRKNNLAFALGWGRMGRIMQRRIHLDCSGRTAREILEKLVGEFQAPKNGRRVVLIVQNVERINDSLSRLIRQILDFFHEREIKASIVDPTGCTATLCQALGGSVHVEVCADEGQVARPLEVLVVEDTADSLEFVRTLLESAGHKVVCARTGREAIAAARKGRFDVILLDLVLPDIDGMIVAGEIADLKVPIVAMSAYLDRWSEVDFRRAGFRHRLRKPFKTADLLTALKS
jgi:CheY-like chemotaxis protein